MAGQTPVEFTRYANYVTPALRPLGYSFYKRLIDFATTNATMYFEGVKHTLTNIGKGNSSPDQFIVLPHIAVHLGYGDGSEYAVKNKEVLRQIWEWPRGSDQDSL